MAATVSATGAVTSSKLRFGVADTSSRMMLRDRSSIAFAVTFWNSGFPASSVAAAFAISFGATVSAPV